MSSEKQTFNALLRNQLWAFIRRSFLTVSPGDHYLDNWHIRAIAYQLMRVWSGEVTRLIITMPPRHLKSISASVAFPAWLLGKDPTSRIICVSYAEDLATKLSLDCKTVMASAWYHECFPGTVLNSVNNKKEEFGTTQQGFRQSTSVGGALTGMGGDYLLIDDPQKADDAQSQTKRHQVYEWYKNTAVTRLNDPQTGRIVVIQQRFHEEDLVGCLLESDGWTHLNLPAIAEQEQSIPIGDDQVHTRVPHEVLHPQRMPMDELMRMKREMGSQAFAGQYQQRPAPAGGEIVKLEWFDRYYEPPEREDGDLIVQSWDFAFTISDRSDYTVCLTFLVKQGKLYLMHVYRKRHEVTDLRRIIPKLAQIKGADLVIMEQAGGSLQVVMELRQLDPHKYQAYSPKKDKELRLMKYAHLIEQARIVLPVSEPWLREFERELEAFPNGKYKDQVDAFSQILNFLYDKSNRPRTSVSFHDMGRWETVYDDDDEAFRLPED